MIPYLFRNKTVKILLSLRFLRTVYNILFFCYNVFASGVPACMKEVGFVPFIHTRVNRPISQEAEKKLAQEYGQAISLLGKSESWLMLQFEDNCRLYFKGDSRKPLAFVNVKLYGKAGGAAYEKLTEKVTGILGETLDIPADGVYVEYEETEHWGWNGSNF